MPARNNVIVRPYHPPALLIQLDDLNVAAIERVARPAFMIVGASPGNHQACNAVMA